MEFDQIKKEVRQCLNAVDLYGAKKEYKFVIAHHDEYRQVLRNAMDEAVHLETSGGVDKLSIYGLRVIHTYSIPPGNVIIV